MTFYANDLKIEDPIQLHWRPWRPAGYTDDLGIMADRNQWAKEELPGWYGMVHRSKVLDIHKWCNENLKGEWRLGGAAINQRQIYIAEERDVTLFLLRWS